MTDNSDVKNAISTIMPIIQSQTRITSSQLQFFEPIFTLSELSNLPKELHYIAASNFNIKMLKAEEKPITEDCKYPDLFIVGKGALVVCSNDDDPKKLVNWWKKHKHSSKLTEGPTKERIILEGHCIGDAHILTGKKWKRITVMALEDCTVLSINLAIIDKKLKDFSKGLQSKDITKFITNYIPIFNKLSRYQPRFLSALKEEFSAGSYIMRQGSVCTHTCLIIEGECKIVVEANPMEEIYKQFTTTLIDTSLRPKRGYLSKTLSNFQIGIYTTGQWLGDCCVLSDDNVHLYSAVVTTAKFRCFQLSIQEYKLMPPEMKEWFVANAQGKAMWIAQRINHLLHNINRVLLIEKPNINYNENLIETKRKHPKASENALLSIRKKGIQGTLADNNDNLLSFKSACSTIVPSTFSEIKNLHSSSRKNSPIKFIGLNTVSEFPKFSDSKEIKNRNRSILHQASHTKVLDTLIPITTQDKRVRSISNVRSTDNRNIELEESITKSLAIKHLNAFTIGKKAINMMELKNAMKPPTPNPFRSLNKRVCITCSNSPSHIS